MQNYSTFVGMDVHKKFIQAHAHTPETGEVFDIRVDNDPAGIKKLMKKAKKITTGEILFCYEAGVCGFAISRRIQALGHPCQVIAPSLIPVKAGDRVKNDRLDAIKLTEYLRGGYLTEVRQPTPEEEALRNLCRARFQEVMQLMRCRHWISKFCIRQGVIYGEKTHWSDKHIRWLLGLKFPESYDQIVFDNYLLCMQQAQERLKSLEEKIINASTLPKYKVEAANLQCLRGIKEITAMTLISEIHDVNRFSNAKQLMAYTGLTPGEYSSGDTKASRGITKTGNGHIRRIITEAAWSNRLPVKASRSMVERRRGQPSNVVALAEKAQHRLHKKYWRMVNQGKHQNKIVAAVAREMMGYVWAELKLANKETGNEICLEKQECRKECTRKSAPRNTRLAKNQKVEIIDLTKGRKKGITSRKG